ncbi:MAG: hypothetical protein DYG94_03420 [Leptolyngbya sp. PLA3]|nr:MAG: hypothetical protein EDM82_10880 [Cyanobacteria bacterium CYA]MCE7967781.1 hypothetical protein [Leptolyngbya sp. PL-A3]
MRRSVVIAALMLVVATLALMTGLARSRVIRAPWHRDPESKAQRIKASVDRFQEACAGMEVIPASAVSSEQQIDQILARAFASTGTDVAQNQSTALSPLALNQLRSDLAGILYRRWWDSSFESYSTFMESRGYEIRSGDDLVSHCGIDLIYSASTGKPWDPSLPPKQAVEEVWNAKPPCPVPLTELKALVTDSTGLGIAFGQICPGDLEYYPTPPGPLGESGWLGERQVGFNVYFQAGGARRSEQLASRRCVMLATVGCVMQLKDGRFIPMLFFLWFDQDAGRWILEKAGAGNIPEGVGGIGF